MLNIFQNQCQTGCSSTWWLDDNEASLLAEFLSDAAKGVEQQQLEHIGSLAGKDSSGIETNPWLTITVQQNNSRPNANSVGVHLHFDDELIQETENDGILWLSGDSARHLSRFLSEAIERKATHPPHIYVPPQPGNVVIASAIAN
ncbi:MAG TPA: hypothetical protein DDZ80_17970 [Cyanobacteria bacterium UBA8803]|nr:hypothetical protein [Cyanobacteria bacterium UBA9273]HBL60273.1 hypothetical protein [Cyanobacteria bacterium UBA8803]